MMNVYDIKRNLGATAKKILEGKLFSSLEDLKAISNGINSVEISSAIEKLQDNYEAMLRFVSEGTMVKPDKDLLDTITAESLALAMRLMRSLSLETGSELYFSTYRALSQSQNKPLYELVREYKDELRRLDNDYESLTSANRTLKAEQYLRDIFNKIWVTHPLTAEDFAAIEEMVMPMMPFHARASVISAVGLGHLSYYDSKRLAWLLEKYISFAESEPELGIRALVDALVSFIRYRRRPLPHNVKTVFAAAQDVPFWEKDFTRTAIELMRASTTDRISERVKDGFLDKLENIDSELRDKIAKGEIDMEALSADYNPEWIDKLEESGIGEGLKEMAELQADGGDVFMTSFSQMKRFPFFHELANWFLPFYVSHSAVATADAGDGIIGSMLVKMPLLCDSDKYSLLHSVQTIPAEQREQLAKAMQMQADQMSEGLSEIEKASDETVRRHYINLYIRNLYRFVNLFRCKDDFFNYFNASGKSPDLLQITALAGNPALEEDLEAVAEFYFKNRNWKEAAQAFSSLDKRTFPEALRTQKMAYAYERAGMIPEALERYEEAEMLDSNSLWTVRRFGKLLRETGDFKRASRYFKRVAESMPDDGMAVLSAAEVLLEADCYSDAEQLFHKAVYMMPDSSSAKRGLAWTLFMNKKFDKASEIYGKILSENPGKDDLLRMAFVHWAKGNIKETLNMFNSYVSFKPSDLDFVPEGGKKQSLDQLDAEVHNYSSVLSGVGIDVSVADNLMETIRFLNK